MNITFVGLQAGIRVTISLTNYWPEFGGIGWYVNNIVGRGNAQELFYTNPRVIAAYQTWVRLRVATKIGWGFSAGDHIHAIYAVPFAECQDHV